jgi:hypothetical protein
MHAAIGEQALRLLLPKYDKPKADEGVRTASKLSLEV